ncbi:leukocyte elastase inhibitor-like [Dreissena polymorpha]|uniref:leukocyte elastase inhibitor-like n=1 Tax=Dreissena polymorpha TaxID=45954 RepID=UPI002263E575|nr:leukocyte elastase inhibitor-like [Dreissena polymorpha]XP_052242982.1 leukocyte elastase inhibitor-like [Dreissena polymorpha]
MTTMSSCASKFSLDLFQHVVSQNPHGNLFMSPSSISVVMTMVQTGARNETRNQMISTLQFQSNDQLLILADAEQFVKVLNKGSDHVILRSANRLYPNSDKGILEDYIKAVVKHFASDVKNVDFKLNPEGSRQEINKWVEEVTNEKIKNLLPSGSINSLTRMVIANAIYFKGNWAIQFEPKSTKKSDFHTLDGKSLKIDMMKREMKKVRYGENTALDCKVLHLPYIGDEMAMVVLLPNTVTGLLEMEKRINVKKINQCIEDVYSPTVKVSVPKFKLESSLQLSDTLSALGMPDVFDANKSDLSGMGKDLFVSEVFHKAFVDVNEEGTEAAAATAGTIVFFSAPPPPKIFTADHPFMFMIWLYPLKAPLFVGRYTGSTLEAAQSRDKL